MTDFYDFLFKVVTEEVCNDEMKIRRVNIHDPEVRKQLKALQKICLPYDEPFPVDDGYWWVATDGDEPVGFGGLIQSVRWADCGYLCRSGVVPYFRGKGIQKKLIRVRLAHAKAIGWNWVITDTTDNPASSNSLIATGFRLFEPSKPWAFKHSLYWRKRV
jgi:GNAT superfamily N-acetyltransferase